MYFALSVRSLRIPKTLSLSVLLHFRTMKSFIQVVGHSSSEGPPMLIINYDKERYMFNCSEGTQRLCVEQKVRLTKLKHIFLTRTQWQTMGGVPGMLLTLTDIGSRSIDIHGGRNTNHAIAAMRHFLYRTQAIVNVYDKETSADVFDDGNLRVIPVCTLPTHAQGAGEAVVGQKRAWHQEGESNALDIMEEAQSITRERWISENGQWISNRDMEALSDKDKMDYRRFVISQMFSMQGSSPAPGHTLEADCAPRSNHPLAENKTGAPPNTPTRNFRQREHLWSGLPSTTPYPVTVSYICHGPAIPGKFKKQAAMALGIKPGPLYGKLQKGISVTLEDGRVIHQEQVCDPTKPGHIFMVVDCPDVDYIDPLTASPQFEAYQKEKGTHTPNTIVHLLGDEVLADARYRAWMNTFPDETEHIISTKLLSPQTVLYKRHALSQWKLSQLNTSIFPIPKYNNSPQLVLDTFSDLPPRTIPLVNDSICHLEPRTGTDPNAPKSYIFDPTNTADPDIQSFDADGECRQIIEKAVQEAEKVPLESFPGDDLEVITLGTGSAIPSKYRNVSATLVKIPDTGSLLLDAGEGTYGQILRLFGQDQLAQELGAIKTIFISHLHADHHLGVIQLLTQWYKLNKDTQNTLTVIAPRYFYGWLKEYSEVEAFGFQREVVFINIEEILLKKTPNAFIERRFSKAKQSLGLSNLQPVEVIHCLHAYGLSVEHTSGWKLAYSGDTRPCSKLIAEGMNATLLVHEASFEDDMVEEAKAKKHTTTGEAVEVGNRMNARFTLLNHFSQRYPKVPLLASAQENVFYSFDMMTIALKQFPILPKFTQAIQLFFKEVEKEDKEN
ncbi:beta-lactamase-like protein [Spinellus fusiger]|nr:beta-lactamase-like protein [Spinellus fusiger]